MSAQIQHPNPGFVWKLTPNKNKLLENLTEENQQDIVDGIDQNASEAILYATGLIPGERGLIAKETFRQTIQKHATRTLFVFYRNDIGSILLRNLTEGEIEEVPIKPWMQTNELQAQLIKARWERFPLRTHPHEIFWETLKSTES